MPMARRRSGCSLNGTIDPRAPMAAANNADWYAMMADLYGCRYRRDAAALVLLDPPPAFHSWMVTLDPDAVAAQRDIIANHPAPGFGFKDGFARIDGAALGRRLGFEASWIYRAAQRACATDGWEQITTPAALLAWENAWAASSPTAVRQFPNAILARSDVIIWGRRSAQGYDAGGIANRSGDCTGLSNVFGADAMGPVARLTQDRIPDLPLVGYERGADLDAALAAGFSVTGPLRVWFGA